MYSKKILLLVTQDHGGAGLAMHKITMLLRSQGHQAVLVVKNKIKSDDYIIEYKFEIPAFLNFWTNLKNKLSRKYHKYLNPKKSVYNNKYDDIYCFYSTDEKSTNVNPKNFFKQIGFIPEFIFSGWTADFLNSSDVLLLQQISKAQVYTIAIDMNHYTGGCHYGWDCKGYINGCTDSCPAILSNDDKNLAKENFEIKFQNAKKGGFKIISGSGWTLEQSKVSKIYQNQILFPNINSLIDTSIMKPINKTLARAHFGLQEDKFYILMGCQNANDKRKGFEYLVEALDILRENLNPENNKKVVVLVVSKNKLTTIEQIKFETKQLDFVDNYADLAMLYEASDVFVNSSIEDSGPMMVSESLACGTPVVAFDMGVANNLVISFFNGYKAKLKDTNDLAAGIKHIIELQPEIYKNYARNATETIKNQSSFETGIKVFNEILNQ